MKPTINSNIPSQHSRTPFSVTFINCTAELGLNCRYLYLIFSATYAKLQPTQAHSPQYGLVYGISMRFSCRTHVRTRDPHNHGRGRTHYRAMFAGVSSDRYRRCVGVIVVGLTRRIIIELLRECVRVGVCALVMCVSGQARQNTAQLSAAHLGVATRRAFGMLLVTCVIHSRRRRLSLVVARRRAIMQIASVIASSHTILGVTKADAPETGTTKQYHLFTHSAAFETTVPHKIRISQPDRNACETFCVHAAHMLCCL